MSRLAAELGRATVLLGAVLVGMIGFTLVMRGLMMGLAMAVGVPFQF